MAKKVVFLDRDGPINVDHGYVNKIKNWQWAKGVIKALKELQEADYTLAVITNQSGIARGYYTEEDMHKLHDHMQRELGEHGVKIASIAFCPHARPEKPEDMCSCRKPNTGMIEKIEEDIGVIDYSNSWTIGDKIIDMELGKKIGTKTALVQSGYWDRKELKVQPDVIVDSLADAVPFMVKN